MRCVVCHRFLRRVAAQVPAVYGGEHPHEAGPAGPRCAAKIGALPQPKRRLFDRARKMKPTPQRDWLRESDQ